MDEENKRSAIIPANYDATIVAWWKELNRELTKAEKEMKKRYERNISLHQREDTERLKTSVDEWKESSGVKSIYSA